LLALPPDVLASLKPRDRTILELYYGLGDHEPRSQYAVAAEFGVRQDIVSRVVRSLTGRLLGWRVLGPGGRLQTTCAICGTTIDQQRSVAGR
jgi:hypothetical protein